jgi:hypothetical protein
MFIALIMIHSSSNFYSITLKETNKTRCLLQESPNITCTASELGLLLKTFDLTDSIELILNENEKIINIEEGLILSKLKIRNFRNKFGYLIFFKLNSDNSQINGIQIDELVLNNVTFGYLKIKSENVFIIRKRITVQNGRSIRAFLHRSFEGSDLTPDKLYLESKRNQIVQKDISQGFFELVSIDPQDIPDYSMQSSVKLNYITEMTIGVCFGLLIIYLMIGTTLIFSDDRQWMLLQQTQY